MAFKQVCSSLFVAVACCTVLSMATPLSYLRDNDQSGWPLQNQGNQGLVYLNDNGANQAPAVYPYQNGQVNVVNNLGGLQSVSSYPNTISNVGLVGNNGWVGNNAFASNIISNNVNSVNGLSTVQSVQYPAIVQTVPVNQYVSSPIVQSIPQYAAVQQPAYISGPVGYQNSYPNQVTNNQVAPVEVNIVGNPRYC